MKGELLVGGGFFTHDQMRLGELIMQDPLFEPTTIDRKDLNAPRLHGGGDFVVVFGMKKLDRLSRKDGLSPRESYEAMVNYFEKAIPARTPLIVVDDFSTATATLYQEKLMRFFAERFDLRLYLLREYLRGMTYAPFVQPFSLPSDRLDDLRRPNADKELDLFFQGNASSRDRVRITRKIQRHFPELRTQLNVTRGGTKNVADRMERPEFLTKLASSRMCLSFAGSGFDCYRYHEIASVGSVIVSPEYPLVIRNDYVDMESCIKFGSVRELRKKLRTAVESRDLLDELQSRSIDRFDRFHTSEKRAEEFKDFVLTALHASPSAIVRAE